MAKKTLSADLAKRISAMGITTNSEDDARVKLLEILQKNDIDGMEEEDTVTLVEIAESFYEGGAETEEQAPATSKESEEELDNLAQEVEGEQAEEEPEEESEEEEEEDGDKFDKMSRNELKKYNTENELGVTVKKNMTDDDLRDAIRAAEAASETTAPAPEKKDAKKAEKPAPAKKEKAEKKAAEKKPSKRGTKLNPKDNEEDREHFAKIVKLFPEGEYNYAWVSTSGVTIKHQGANGQRGIALLENCSLQADGSVKCNLFLLTMTKQTEVLDEAGIDYELCWTKAPFMRGITLDAAYDILEKVKDAIVATVTKIDKRLGDNREKMEKNLKGAAKKTAKK